MQYVKILIQMVLMVATMSVMAAEHEYTLDELVNPNIANRNVYVADPAHLLNTDAVQHINARLSQLRHDATVEMAVVVVPSIGDESVTDFATDLFEKWGIGKSDNDNGVLFIMVLDQHEGRIATGYGVEGVLSDVVCSTILQQEMIPRMKDDNLDGAVMAVTDVVANVLSDPTAAAEVRSKAGENYNREAVDKEELKEIATYAFTAGTAITAILFVIQLFVSRGRDSYHRAVFWRDSRLYYIIASVASLGGGLIFLLLVLFLAHRARNHSRKCATCGHKMHKLSEEADNAFLTPAEDLEEQLDTVDYDVWKCDNCGRIDKFAYPKMQNKYKRCPRCGTMAMRLKGDFEVKAPTYTTKGIRERVYECKYCGHIDRQRYETEPKSDDSAAAAIAAGALLGGIASRRGGGGGSFGGGFGGGHTGGGGASGRW